MKFKNFINELDDNMNSLSGIKVILSQMSPDELREFGEWLYDEIDSEDVIFDNFDDDYTLEALIEVINSLDSEDLEYILDMLGDDDSDDSDDDEDADDLGNDYDNTENDDELEEVAGRFRNKSKGRRKFQKTRAELRVGKSKRKADNRHNKMSRKRYYAKNKVKIKKYSKTYHKAIKTGMHRAKVRV